MLNNYFKTTNKDVFFAPAKVNLGLSVCGLRNDGYHELHSLMVPLNIGDTLSITRAKSLSLRVVGANLVGANLVGANLPTDERNLVYRAARAYANAYFALLGQQIGANIILDKQLPLASGMGGGSSDAATTLMALAQLYPADINLAALAIKLGADVPFFLLKSAALAQGIGEVLTPITLPKTALVLVNPSLEISARNAYLWLDEAKGFTPELPLAAIQTALAQGGEVPYFNALQAPVMAKHTLLKTVLDALTEAGLHSPLMSGSGSTCFGLAGSVGQAQAAAKALQQRFPSWWVQVAETA